MKGLIKKDLIVLKNNSRFYVILIALYFVIGLFADFSSFLAGMLAVLGISLVLGIFSYDEMAKWDQYALSLAVTRREVVRAKYLVAILLTGVTSVVGFFLSLATQLIHGQINLGESALSLATLFAVVLMINALVIPCMYRFGVEKGRAAMILCCMAVVGLVFLFSWLGNNTPLFVVMSSSPVLTTLLLVSLLYFFLSLSYWISYKIYEKKELG